MIMDLPALGAGLEQKPLLARCGLLILSSISLSHARPCFLWFSVWQSSRMPCSKTKMSIMPEIPCAKAGCWSGSLQPGSVVRRCIRVFSILEQVLRDYACSLNLLECVSLISNWLCVKSSMLLKGNAGAGFALYDILHAFMGCYSFQWHCIFPSYSDAESCNSCTDSFLFLLHFLYLKYIEITIRCYECSDVWRQQLH